MRLFPHALFLLVLLAPLWPGTSHAQTVPFGKNKVQYTNFDWHVLAGEHVDVYFYPEEEDIARMALQYAEESFLFLRERFQHHPFQRVPLVVYSSHQHFEQTNVTQGFIPEGVLGFTEFLKGRVALPFRGNYAQFRHTLRHELVHFFQLSKLGETFELHGRNRSAGLPLWWTEGLAEFWSSPQDTRDEMHIRDVVLNGRIPRLIDFTYARNFLVYPLGGELHHYLARRFGERRIVEMYEEIWRYDSFEQAFQFVYGISLEELDREWRFFLEQRYFPNYADRPPLEVATRPVIRESGPNFKPVVRMLPGDTIPQLFYMSPRTGYTNIYRAALPRGRAVQRRDPVSRPVVEGQRSAEFESLHFFESRIDLSHTGVLAFISKSQESDALFLWDLARERVVGRYRWDDLSGLQSPAWSPDGTQIVFSGLALSGMVNLYIVDFETGERRQVTSDHYEDLDADWSPDGRFIVFSSDRTSFGEHGARNLFLFDVERNEISYLTHGDWQDQAPRWSEDGSRVAFTSDRSGFFELYVVNGEGEGERVSHFAGAAMDPAWLPDGSGIVFTGFSKGNYLLYHQPLEPGLEVGIEERRIALTSPAGALEAAGAWGASGADVAASSISWKWEESASVDTTVTTTRGYSSRRSFSMDFAGGDALIAPGVGSAQGIQFLGSDMLGNHIIFMNVAAVQSESFRNLSDAFSGQLLYLNMSRRLNLGGGIFRQKGLFRDVAFNIYEEASHGAFFIASYPFSRFERLELQLGVEQSDRIDRENFFSPDARDDPRDLTRDAVLTRNSLSFIKDNTLWLSTGPVDGSRYNLTAGLMTDLSSARAESVILMADYRRYLRTSFQSALALRTFGFYSDGAIPERAVLGGPQQLRGYPRFTLAGSRVWLVNTEWRFPLTNAVTLHLPFGNLTFPGIQSALFGDLGSSWLEGERPDGSWGSYGLGFRINMGYPLVLRMDVGRRFKIGEEPPLIYRAGDAFDKSFVDFFFGFNF